MKKLTLLSLFLLSVSMFFYSCKDTLDINVEKTFVQQAATGNSLGFGGMILKLYPDKTADILYGGDIYYKATYSIKGSKLKVKEGDNTTEFNIISPTELGYEDKILRLTEY